MNKLIRSRRPKNVLAIHRDAWCEPNLICWVNFTMQCNVENIQELKTGAIYCQIIHRLYPKAIQMNDVKLMTRFEVDFEHNFALLEDAFKELNVINKISTRELIKGRCHYEFANWLRKFYIVNDLRRPYNPRRERGGKSIGLIKSPAQWNQDKKKWCPRSTSLDLTSFTWNLKRSIAQNRSSSVEIGGSNDLSVSQLKLLNGLQHKKEKRTETSLNQDNKCEHKIINPDKDMQNYQEKDDKREPRSQNTRKPSMDLLRNYNKYEYKSKNPDKDEQDYHRQDVKEGAKCQDYQVASKPLKSSKDLEIIIASNNYNKYEYKSTIPVDDNERDDMEGAVGQDYPEVSTPSNITRTPTYMDFLNKYSKYKDKHKIADDMEEAKGRNYQEGSPQLKLKTTNTNNKYECETINSDSETIVNYIKAAKNKKKYNPKYEEFIAVCKENADIDSRIAEVYALTLCEEENPDITRRKLKDLFKKYTSRTVINRK